MSQNKEDESSQEKTVDIIDQIFTEPKEKTVAKKYSAIARELFLRRDREIQPLIEISNFFPKKTNNRIIVSNITVEQLFFGTYFLDTVRRKLLTFITDNAGVERAIACISITTTRQKQSRFSNVPIMRFLTPKVIEEILVVSDALKIDPPMDSYSIYKWCYDNMRLIGVTGISGYVKTTSIKEVRRKNKLRKKQSSKKTNTYVNHNRKTCRAYLKQTGKPQAGIHYTQAVRARNCFSLLLGRMSVYGPSFYKNICRRISCTGMLHFLGMEFIKILFGDIRKMLNACPATVSAIIIYVAEMQIINADNRGTSFLPIGSAALFKIAIDNESRALPILGLIAPYEEIFDKIPSKFISRIYEQSVYWADKIGWFMEMEYNKGLSKAVNRGCRMPISTDRSVNGYLYNECVSAWNFLQRLVYISGRHVAKPKFMIRVRSLIGNSRFKNGKPKIPYEQLQKILFSFQGEEGRCLPNTGNPTITLHRLLCYCDKLGCDLDWWLGTSETCLFAGGKNKKEELIWENNVSKQGEIYLAKFGIKLMSIPKEVLEKYG